MAPTPGKSSCRWWNGGHTWEWSNPFRSEYDTLMQIGRCVVCNKAKTIPVPHG